MAAPAQRADIAYVAVSVHAVVGAVQVGRLGCVVLHHFLVIAEVSAREYHGLGVHSDVVPVDILRDDGNYPIAVLHELASPSGVQKFAALGLDVLLEALHGVVEACVVGEGCVEIDAHGRRIGGIATL